MTNITEAPEAPGGLLATGWDTPLVHPTTAEYALGEHACHLAAQRDAALGTAARLHAENQRLHAELRAMRGRVAGQRETIRRLRRDAAWSGRWAGRWLPWSRAQRARDER